MLVIIDDVVNERVVAYEYMSPFTNNSKDRDRVWLTCLVVYQVLNT